MSSIIENRSALSRIGDFVFTRQPPLTTAERHASLAKNLHSWRARNKAEAELSALSDRSLADIGLTREDIHGIAAQAGA